MLAPVLVGPAAPRWLPWLGAACAAAPDLDVIGLALGVPYAHPLGHRGLSHALPFAAFAAACLAAVIRRPGLPPARLWLYLFLVIGSHGVLDAATDGGLGVALLAPFDERRVFLPFRPIAVSPIGAAAFVSARGVGVLASELVWVWLPAGLLWLALRRRRRAC